MKKLISFIKNKTASDDGTIFLIGISIILAVISMLSSVSLVFSAQSDFTHILYSQDIFQEELLLRSENMRTNIRATYDKFSPIPSNAIVVESSETKTTYNIKNKNSIIAQEMFMGFPLEEVMTIRSLITAKRSASHFSTGYNSPIKRYCERLLSDESLARYQYFTNTEASENADGGVNAGDVHFWGRDEFFGKVFSNDDIWISDTNGWPVFHDFVGTAGIFRYSPGGDHLINHVDYDAIFPAGWAENAAPIIYNPKADLVRRNGLRPFEGFQDFDIARVHLNGQSFTSVVGKIVLDEIKEFPVYSWYPKNTAEANAAVNAGYNWFEEEDSLWTNHVPIFDTLWSAGPSSSVAGHSVFIEGLQLWIDGVVTGKQTWACSDTIYIVDDITYSGTPAGNAPDDDDQLNHNDFFGLVSEQRIYIKYKFKDPLDLGQLNDHNCHSIYLYGSFAALGQADPAIYGEHACHHDGIFTYEYQHPHGSNPNFIAKSPYTNDDSLYTYIDLHKFIFPKNYYVAPNLVPYNIHGNAPMTNGMCGYPYEIPAYQPGAHAIPYGTDYPWYNPIWPESSNTIVGERGAIHMYGAIHQTRRGYVHRSGIDPFNHPGDNQWDISNEVYHFDGTHPSTGYDKDYHYDNRFLFVSPPDYPKVYKGIGESSLTSLEQFAWYFKTPPDHF